MPFSPLISAAGESVLKAMQTVSYPSSSDYPRICSADYVAQCTIKAQLNQQYLQETAGSMTRMPFLLRCVRSVLLSVPVATQSQSHLSLDRIYIQYSDWLTCFTSVSTHLIPVLSLIPTILLSCGLNTTFSPLSSQRSLVCQRLRVFQHCGCSNT